MRVWGAVRFGDKTLRGVGETWRTRKGQPRVHCLQAAPVCPGGLRQGTGVGVAGGQGISVGLVGGKVKGIRELGMEWRI